MLKDALAFLYAAASDGLASSIRVREKSAVLRELQAHDRMLYLFWRCLEAGSTVEQSMIPNRLAAEILLGLKRQSGFRLGACTGNLSSPFPAIRCRKDSCMEAAVNLLQLLSADRSDGPIEVRITQEGAAVAIEFELAVCGEISRPTTAFPSSAGSKTWLDPGESQSIRLLLWQRVLRENGIVHEVRQGTISCLKLKLPSDAQGIVIS